MFSESIDSENICSIWINFMVCEQTMKAESSQFLDFTNIEDFRENLFIANFFRGFVKTPHGQIFVILVIVL